MLTVVGTKNTYDLEAGTLYAAAYHASESHVELMSGKVYRDVQKAKDEVESGGHKYERPVVVSLALDVVFEDRPVS